MTITKRKILWGCGCSIMVLGCLIVFLLGLLFWVLYPSYQLDPKNPAHKEFMEDHIGFQFPASAKWKKGVVHSFPFDYAMTCLFTLPKKDINKMFPPEKIVWHEDDQTMLSVLDKKWLSEDTLKNFKIATFEYRDYNDNNRPHGNLEIIIGNNPLQSDDEEVEVLVSFGT